MESLCNRCFGTFVVMEIRLSELLKSEVEILKVSLSSDLQALTVIYMENGVQKVCVVDTYESLYKTRNEIQQMALEWMHLAILINKMKTVVEQIKTCWKQFYQDYFKPKFEKLETMMRGLMILNDLS